MSSPSPEEEAAAALRPLALGALSATSIALRETQRREAHEAEQTRARERQERDEQREQQRQDERAERAREQAARDQQRAADDRRRLFQVASRDPLWTGSASREQMTRAVETLRTGPAGNPLDQVAVQRIDEAGRKRFGDAWQMLEAAAGHESTFDSSSSSATDRTPDPAHDAQLEAAAPGDVQSRSAPPSGVPSSGGAVAGPAEPASAAAQDGLASAAGYGASRFRGRAAGGPLVPPVMRSPDEADRGQEDERD